MRVESVPHQIVNPWTWQERYGYVQGHEVVVLERILFCSGQVSIDECGNCVYEADMAGQMRQALSNLERVLASAGYGFADVVRLNVYTTDLEAYFEHKSVLTQRLEEAGCRFASTLLGVARLGFPQLLIELEATAAK